MTALNIFAIIMGLIVVFKILQTVAFMFGNYRRIGKKQTLFKTEDKQSSKIVFQIKEPLKFFGKSNDFLIQNI